jgi:hypothetical protein
VVGVRRRTPRRRHRPPPDAVLRLLAARAATDAATAPDHVHLRPRWQPDRDAALDGRPDDHPALGDARAAAARRDRGRRQGLLRAPRRRRRRRLPSGVDRPRRAGDCAGRFDDHAAAREERLRGPVRGGSRDRCRDLRGPAPDVGAEGAREPAGDQGRARVHQGPDPRQVPQHRLLRSGRVRGAGRGADVLPEGRARPHGQRVGPPRRDDPEPLVLRPRGAGGRGPRTAELRPRADGGRGLPLARARGEARRQGHQGGSDRGRTELPRQARVLPRLHAAGTDRSVRRRAGLQRRTAGDDDARLGDAGVCGGGRREPPQRSGRPRGCAGGDRSEGRGRPRDVRRPELRDVEGEPRDRRRRLRAAGRVGVQAVHACRGDGEGLLAGLTVERTVSDHDPGPGVLHGRRAVGAVERERLGERDLHPALGDHALGEHGVRAGRVRGHPESDRGRR